MISESPWSGKNETRAPVGPIEASLRAKRIEIQRRFARLQSPPVRVTERPRPVSPFHASRTNPAELERAGAVAAEVRRQVAEVKESIRKLAPWRAILEEVAAAHGITPADITGSGRLRPIVIARQECCYRLVVECGLSFPAAGRRLTLDHATIMYGVKCHLKRHPELEPAYQEHVAAKITAQSSRYRDVVRMYFDEGKSVPEIMKATGMDRNLVNSFIRSEVRKVRQQHMGAPG